MPGRQDRYRVLIAGGGVAALEAMVALRTLAEDRVDIELLSPRPRLLLSPARRSRTLWPGKRASLRPARARDRLRREAPPRLRSRRSTPPAPGNGSGHGESLTYDSLLLLAMGARQPDRAPRRLDLPRQRGHSGLLADSRRSTERRSQEARLRRPDRRHMAAAALRTGPADGDKAAEEGVEARIMFITPEETPLGVFGHEGSQAVAGLLADRAIELRTSIHAERFEEGLVHLVPGAPLAGRAGDRASRALSESRLRAFPHDGRGSYTPTPSDGSRPSTMSTRPETGRASRSNKVAWPPSRRTRQPRRSQRKPAPRSSPRPSTRFCAVSF